MFSPEIMGAVIGQNNVVDLGRKTCRTPASGPVTGPEAGVRRFCQILRPITAVVRRGQPDDALDREARVRHPPAALGRREAAGLSGLQHHDEAEHQTVRVPPLVVQHRVVHDHPAAVVDGVVRLAQQGRSLFHRPVVQHATEDHDIRTGQLGLEEVGPDEVQLLRDPALGHEAVEVPGHGRTVQHGAGQPGMGGREVRRQVAAGATDIAERRHTRPVEDLRQLRADRSAEAVHGGQELAQPVRVVEDLRERDLAVGALAAGGAAPQQSGEGLLVAAHELGGHLQEAAHEPLAVRQQVPQCAGAVAVAAVLAHQEADGGQGVEEVPGAARMQTRTVGQLGGTERAFAQHREDPQLHRRGQELAPEEGPPDEHHVEGVLQRTLPGPAGLPEDGPVHVGSCRRHACRTSFFAGMCTSRRPIRERSRRSTGRS
nr:hypothetical protein [Streptomyces sp. HUCO-GS316]